MSIIDNAKEIASLVQKLGDVNLYRKIVELEGEIVELTRENRELAEKLAEVSRSQSIIENLDFDAPFYATPDGSGLYCTRCVEADRRAVHVAKTAELQSGRRVYVCPQCKSKYVDMRVRAR